MPTLPFCQLLSSPRGGAPYIRGQQCKDATGNAAMWGPATSSGSSIPATSRDRRLRHLQQAPGRRWPGSALYWGRGWGGSAQHPPLPPAAPGYPFPPLPTARGRLAATGSRHLVRTYQKCLVCVQVGYTGAFSFQVELEDTAHSSPSPIFHKADMSPQ